eukprot:scaffold32277_cov108-Isochrysis_galbana.AAC.7
MCALGQQPRMPQSTCAPVGDGWRWRAIRCSGTRHRDAHPPEPGLLLHLLLPELGALFERSSPVGTGNVFRRALPRVIRRCRIPPRGLQV